MNRRGFLAALAAIPAAPLLAARREPVEDFDHITFRGARIYLDQYQPVHIKQSTHYYSAHHTEIAVWDRALSDKEIRHLLNYALPGSSVWIESSPL